MDNDIGQWKWVEEDPFEKLLHGPKDAGVAGTPDKTQFEFPEPTPVVEPVSVVEPARLEETVRFEEPALFEEPVRFEEASELVTEAP